MSSLNNRASQQTNQAKIMIIQKIIDELPSLLSTLSHAKNSTTRPVQNGSSNNDDPEISSTANIIQNSNNNINDNVIVANNINDQDKAPCSGGSNGSSENQNVGKQDNKIDGNKVTRWIQCLPALLTNNNKSDIAKVEDGDGNNKNKSEKAKVADKDESNNTSNNGSNSHSGHYNQKDSQIRKLESNLKQIEDALKTLWNFQEEKLGKEIDSHLRILKTILDNLPPPPHPSCSSPQPAEAQLIFKLQEINKKITKLKRQIPLRRKTSSSSSTASQHNSQSSSSDRVENQNGIDHLPILDWCSGSLVDSSVYEEIQGIFNDLNVKEKACLSCFAVFPENEEVKKRILTYWWVGEGIIEIPEEEIAEKIAGNRLKEFVRKGLIEPIHGKQQIKGIDRHDKSFQMHPLVRSVLIKIAKDSSSTTTSSRAILVKAKEESSNNNNQAPPAAAEYQDPDSDYLYQQYYPEMPNLEGLETIFNVDETFPDARLDPSVKMKTVKAGEWSSKMKNNLKVLYLGKWQNSANYHIEVESESTRFLEGLKNMKSLRLLSLQGISRINELPNSISKMTNLKILDLKECHNLEVLPKGISYLKQLTHLDVSGCYLLDYMPKGLSSLTKLQVLKGFVISDHRKQSGNSCNLKGLEGMKNLRKLSISISRKEDFPKEDELESLQKLEKLRKLTLSWGGDCNRRSSTKINPPKKPAAAKLKPSLSKLGSTIAMNFKAGTDNKQIANTDQHHLKLPEYLEKLDLQCFPEVDVPKWMVPDQDQPENPKVRPDNMTKRYNNLSHLKKLYLRGGRLRDLKEYKWKAVETLRLKFLSDMKMKWEQLRESFPELSLFEKVDCPWVTFCPCDESGVWQNHEKVESVKSVEKIENFSN